MILALKHCCWWPGTCASGSSGCSSAKVPHSLGWCVAPQASALTTPSPWGGWGLWFVLKKAKLNLVKEPPPTSLSVTDTTYRALETKYSRARARLAWLTVARLLLPQGNSCLFSLFATNRQKKIPQQLCNSLHFHFSSIWQPSRKQDTTSQVCKGFTNQIAKYTFIIPVPALGSEAAA